MSAASPTPRRLGRGLDALLGSRKTEPSVEIAQPEDSVQLIRITLISANPYQPRKEFRPQDLIDLQQSLKASGLIQPITVRKKKDSESFELIAGERRLRAATNLGWDNIPALIKNVDDKEALSLALVENLQRADLDPIEEADGYQRLIAEFSATQQQVAEAVGKDRSTVANALRLLQLPASVKKLLQEKKLSTGHARALLALNSEYHMARLAKEAVEKQWSVREIEKQVKSEKGRSIPEKPNAKTEPKNDPETRRIEELLRRKLQTQTRILNSANNSGELRISYSSNEDLERILEIIGVDLIS